MSEKKTLHAPMEIVKADGAEGKVRAIFSTFNVTDSDGDVIMPGAIPNNTPIKLSAWGHNWGTLAVGKGVITTTKEHAVFDGEFFLNTEAGRETFETVKALGELQEWSWGFRIPAGATKRAEKDGRSVRLIEKTIPLEVSPVLIGANPQTATISVKGEVDGDDEDDRDDADLQEDDAEAAKEKEGPTPTETKQLPTVEEVSGVIESLRSLTASALDTEGARLRDIEYMLQALSALETQEWITNFEQSMAEDEFNDGLNDARAKMLKGVAKALEAHDASIVDNRDLDIGVEKFAEQGDRLLASLEAYEQRSKSLTELRAKQGRTLSNANSQRLNDLAERIKSVSESLTEIVSNDETVSTEPIVNSQPDLHSYELHMRRMRLLEQAQIED